MMLLTAFVAMLLVGAQPDWLRMLVACIGIGLTAAAGGVINQIVDHKIDAAMLRTKGRPLPLASVKPWHAVVFAVILCVCGLGILIWKISIITAALSAASLIGYAFIYSVLLKKASPQNIVIGGLAGAMPPLMGSSAISGYIDPIGLSLVILIFVWTPPHFWALCIYREKEYAKTGVPMLTVTHGVPFTKLQVFLYTLLMIAASYLPVIISASHLIYLCGVGVLNAGFLYYVLGLCFSKQPQKWGRDTFRYSIVYLMLLFVMLLLDHFIQ
jgi:heme o synthase